MKNLLISITFVLSFFISKAQSGVNDQLSNQNMLSVKAKTRTNVNIEGSPYITEKFQIIIIKGQTKKNLKGRYNAYNGDMEIKDESKGTVFVLNKNMQNYDVDFVVLNKVYQSYQFKSDKDGVINGFFVKLSENNGISFLKKETVKFFKEIKAVSTYDKARAAKYRRANDQYFIKINDAPAIEFSTKKKELAKVFPDKSKDILKYIKSNKLNTKSEGDLIKLINYISGL